MKTNLIQNEIVDCWQEDDILYGLFKISNLGLVEAIVAVETRTNAANGRAMLFLVDARKVNSTSKAARDYLASEKGTHNIIANTLILDSVIGRFLGNFFLRINKPRVPLKIFNNYTDAIIWLRCIQKETPRKSNRLNDKK